ncbi:MAG: IS21 family transposase, partial [Armatimonadaceae bacterium]
LLCRDEVVATHRRHWGREQTVFDPVHYLALLERKPGAFDHARPLADWPLPECLAVLRRRFETTWGQPGLRHFIRVLRLLEHASLAELAAAVERALAFGVTTADGVRVLLEQTRETPVPLFPLDGRPHLAGVSVPAPDLSAYHAVRTGGGA